MSNSLELPKSPITKTTEVSVFDTISTKDIIRLYREQEGFDVSRFFEGLSEIYILECDKTKYRFYYPFSTIGDASFYEGLRNSEYDRDEADDHKFSYPHIKKDDKVLEIGAGSGKYFEQIASLTTNVVGLELNPKAAETARKKGFDVRTELIENHYPKGDGYDIICAFQVLEHIADVSSFFVNALRLLKPNGKLILSTPNCEPYFQRFSKFEVLNLPPHHMGLWNPSAFKSIASIYGMQLNEYRYSGEVSFKGRLYFRARYLAGVTSMMGKHTTVEKVKMIATMPTSLVVNFIDIFRSRKSYGHITVVLKKDQ